MRVEQFTIIVGDYDKAIGFFTGALGFDLVEDSPSLTNVLVDDPSSTGDLTASQPRHQALSNISAP